MWITFKKIINILIWCNLCVKVINHGSDLFFDLCKYKVRKKEL